MFEHPEPALRWFSDGQITQGLTYLVSTGASGDNGWLYSTEVPIEDRVRCVEAVHNLKERYLTEIESWRHLQSDNIALSSP